jgi:hypothetical protein
LRRRRRRKKMMSETRARKIGRTGMNRREDVIVFLFLEKMMLEPEISIDASLIDEMGKSMEEADGMGERLAEEGSSFEGPEEPDVMLGLDRQLG